MKLTVSPYDHDSDFERVGQFLTDTHRTFGEHINWLQPRWEYMHFHPMIEGLDPASTGIWESDGKIVAVAHAEHSFGTAYFEFGPGRAALKREMLRYAESREPMTRFDIPDQMPSPSLPPGYRVSDLAHDGEREKVHRLLYRGFDNGDEPPEGGLEDRRKMQSAANFEPAHNIVIVASDGGYASYGGIWFEPVHRVAYVEPVATDPDHRRRGLGRAAVMEGIRRCAALGATVAYVGSNQPFYLAMGFEDHYRTTEWVREWTE